MKKDIGVWVISPSLYDDQGRLFQFSRLLMVPPIFGVMRSLIGQAVAELGITADVFSVNERTEAGDDYIKRLKWPWLMLLLLFIA